jgi:nitrogenase-stabilizing/protective protein
MLEKAVSQIECVEELFELLGELYNPEVLRVHRLHILKRFGLEIAMLERRNPPLREEERQTLYAAALKRAHDLYALGGGDAEPLFRPKAKHLVPLRRPSINHTE